MCLSTVYRNSQAEENVCAKYVAKIDVEGDTLTFSDVLGAVTQVEGRLVKYGRLPEVDVLVVGHHGSRYAASEELLSAVRPETAVISCGYNTYGHPAPETLLRLSEAGCDIYRTDLQGTVTISVG